MQVRCERSNCGSDVRCAVCGQGFLVYWERCTRAEYEETRREVMQAIREHHADMMSGHLAHPASFTTVPSWANPIFAGTPMTGGSTAYTI